MGVTINPAVNGVSYRRWGFYTALYGIGIAAGATAVYALVATIEAGVGAVVGERNLLIGLAVIVAAAVARDLGVPVRMPYREQTQVSQRVREQLGPSMTSIVYGAHLGVGFLTRYTYSTHLAFVLLLPLVESGVAVATLIVAFAAAKTYPILVAADDRPYSAFEVANLHRFRIRSFGYPTLRVANATITVAALATVLITN